MPLKSILRMERQSLVTPDNAGLTPKQRRFCEEYLVDLNATQAAIRAGYSRDAAYAIGWENLKKPEIESTVQRLMFERSDATKVTAEQVIDELAKVAFASVKDFLKVDDDGTPYIDVSSMNERQWAAVADVQVDEYIDGRGDDTHRVQRIKIKSHSKLAALSKLADHLGIGNDATPQLDPVDVCKTLQLMRERIDPAPTESISGEQSIEN